MSATPGWRLRLKAQPDFRVDFGGVLPARLAGMTADEVARLEVGHVNARLALGELFDIAALAEGGGECTAELRIEGDLSRFDAIGQGLDGGVLNIDGAVGDRLGLAMRAGEIRVEGAAGQLAGCEMAGGSIEIAGDVGDFAAGALPGSMDGMRGGQLVVAQHLQVVQPPGQQAEAQQHHQRRHAQPQAKAHQLGFEVADLGHHWVTPP